MIFTYDTMAQIPLPFAVVTVIIGGLFTYSFYNISTTVNNESLVNTLFLLIIKEVTNYQISKAAKDGIHFKVWTDKTYEGYKESILAP
jgi:hypothetical protein